MTAGVRDCKIQGCHRPVSAQGYCEPHVAPEARPRRLFRCPVCKQERHVPLGKREDWPCGRCRRRLAWKATGEQHAANHTKYLGKLMQDSPTHVPPIQDVR